MGRTRAAHLAPGTHASHEADEVQEVSQGELASDPGEVNARPGGGPQGRVIRCRRLGETRAWAHVGDGEEKRNPYQSPRG